MIHGNYPPIWQDGASHDVRHWSLTKELLDDMGRSGLGTLHKLYLRENKTEFQKTLIVSLMTYSRSSLRKNPSDRLIYIFTALDSFLLQSDSESIQQNIAERIAFTVSDSGQERASIVKIVLRAYAMRSQAVHHNQNVKDRDTLIEFMQIAWRFYILLINQNEKYQTREQFFEEVRQKKFA